MNRIAEIDRRLAQAAERGIEALREEWSTLHAKEQAMLKAALDRRFKPRAAEIDKAKEAVG